MTNRSTFDLLTQQDDVEKRKKNLSSHPDVCLQSFAFKDLEGVGVGGCKF